MNTVGLPYIYTPKVRSEIHQSIKHDNHFPPRLHEFVREVISVGRRRNFGAVLLVLLVCFDQVQTSRD